MKNILVIEDDAAIRETIVDLLAGEGFSVLEADNGSTGVALAQHQRPDLILCDVAIPELDGYAVLATLRQQRDTATIPFIFLTARRTKDDVRHGMALGADDFLTKPFTVPELLAAIASRLQKQAAVREQSQQQLDSLRSSIALALPHEFRTPLNGILGLAELLLDEYATIERQELLELAEGIHGSAARLYRLIQNFLLYCELELTAHDRERLSLLRRGETHYPSVVITHVATTIAQQSGREADLQLSLQNTKIQISDLKFKKILEELIGNAFKFSTVGTPVQLSSTLVNGGLRLTIADRGRGMTAEQLANLGAYMQFERRFYEQQGSGLGFVIAKRLVELHGGSLTMTSTPGQQTTVQLTFPDSEGSVSETMPSVR